MMSLILRLTLSRFGSAIGLFILIVILLVVRSVVFNGAGDPFWYIVIALLILGWIAWIVYDHYKSKKKSDTIAGSLVGSAKSDEASARPDRRQVYRLLRENLEIAIRLLDKSRPTGVHKGEALYRLPWIMVIGPPADGKSTAIENSGIRWPQDPRMDEATGEAKHQMRVAGSGGTRSCNWFFSADAIILDTAGRWQAREQGKADEDEWLQFLQMLQQARPKRPINGVIALCSIERVLANPAEAKERAQQMRRQINEIMEKLQTHVPVYLILNKCDLIHGFVEYFQDLNQDGRMQIWGFTRPYNPTKKKTRDGLESERDAILADFDREFFHITEVLETRRLHRLIDPQLFPSERAALCIFPSEFREIRVPVREFLSNVFYENPYGHNPALRGIYFTSATQLEGNPIVQLMKQVAGEYNIPLEALPFKSKQTVDTYFVQDLMKDVIFKDTGLGGRFKSSFFDRTRILLASVLGIATVLVGLWMGLSYAVNSGKNHHLAETVAQVRALPGTDKAEAALISLDNLRSGLEDYQSYSCFGLFYWAFGRGSKGVLKEAGDRYLADKANSYFVSTAWADAGKTLRSHLAARSNINQYVDSYKTYLFLSKAAGHDKVEPSVVASYIMNNQFGAGGTRVIQPDQRAKLDSLLDYYHRYVETERFTPDTQLISKGRKSIRLAWDWKQLASDITASASRDLESFTTEDVGGCFVASHAVPGAFTYDGWGEKVGPEFEETSSSLKTDELLAEILGEEAIRWADDSLETAYVKACQDEWASFFGGLEYNRTDLASTLYDLAGPRSPLRSLLEAASDATQFDQPGLRLFFSDLHKFTGTGPRSGLVDSALSMGGKPAAAGSGLTWDEYKEALKPAVEAPFMAGSGSCGEAYRQSVSKINNASSSLRSTFSHTTLALPLWSLLYKPFEYAKAVAWSSMGNCLKTGWKNEVLGPFQADIGNSYPYKKTSSLEKSTADLAEFFGDDGPLQSFDKDQDRSYGLGGAYNKAVGDARAIGRIVSSSGATVDIRFRQGMVAQLQQVQIFQDGRPLFRYANGPDDILKLDVPCNCKDLEIRLQTRDKMTSVKFSGEWAAMRLLDSANVNQGSGRLKFDDVLDVSIDMKVEVVRGCEGLKLYELLRGFRLPSSIM